MLNLTTRLAYWVNAFKVVQTQNITGRGHHIQNQIWKTIIMSRCILWLTKLKKKQRKRCYKVQINETPFHGER